MQYSKLTWNKAMASSRSFKTPTRRYRGNFKSPLPSAVSSPQQTSKTPDCLKTEIKELEEEIGNLDQDIQELQSQGYKEEELNLHIDKLHEYNDMKDTGQMVLGRIANVEGVTTRALYEKYGLKEED